MNELSYQKTLDANPVMAAARRVGALREQYRALLEEHVHLDKLEIPQHPRILSLGCGIAMEAFVQNGYFGRKPFGENGESVDFVGIDIDAEIINRAREHYKRPDFSGAHVSFNPDPHYHFICGDARRLDELVDGNFDVLVASHPEILHRSDVWREIFSAAKKKHNSRGIILATLYIREELESMKGIFDQGYICHVATANKYAKIIPGYTIPFHNFVFVAQKN